MTHTGGEGGAGFTHTFTHTHMHTQPHTYAHTHTSQQIIHVRTYYTEKNKNPPEKTEKKRGKMYIQ